MPRDAALPSLTAPSGLTRYLKKIRAFPMLEAQEEYLLAKCFRERGDREAAQRLVTSHLRLAAKIAMSFRGYGLPISEMISEGNVGLMRAIGGFEPDKGFRVSTYAIWWIRSVIQEYILRSWSWSKSAPTPTRRSCSSICARPSAASARSKEGDLRSDQVKIIAERMSVAEQDVVDMNRRLGGDVSLNSSIRDLDEFGEWQDWLVDDTPSQERVLVENDDLDHRRRALGEALTALSDRERRIFEGRRLAEEPITLAVLAGEFRVSRERVRQIEVRAFEKVQNAVLHRLAAM